MRILAGILLLLTFVVIVLGSYTRLTDAGLGCPDWPGCYGQILVPQSADDINSNSEQTGYLSSEFDREKAVTEMVHRVVAAALGLLIFVVTLINYLQARRRRQKMSRLLLFLCLAVVAQGAFGAWTVTLKLLPQVVLAHLLGGFLIFSVIYLYFLSLGNTGQTCTKNLLAPLRVAIGLGGLLLIAQIVLGGWVSANYAARICTDFPLCNGEWIPAQADFIAGFNFWQPPGLNYEGGALSAEAQLAIHFAHRLNAFVLLLYWLLLFYFGRRNHSLQESAPLFMGLLLFQMGLGITNILADLPLTVAVAHNGLAAILLLSFLRMLILYQNNFTEQFPFQEDPPEEPQGESQERRQERSQEKRQDKLKAKSQDKSPEKLKEKPRGRPPKIRPRKPPKKSEERSKETPAKP